MGGSGRPLPADPWEKMRGPGATFESLPRVALSEVLGERVISTCGVGRAMDGSCAVDTTFLQS